MSQSIEKIFYPLHHANPMRFYEGEDGIVFEYDDGDAARNFVSHPHPDQRYTCATVRVQKIEKSADSIPSFPNYNTMMEKKHPLDYFRDYVVTEQTENRYYFRDYEIKMPSHILAESWIVFDVEGENVVGIKEYAIMNRLPSVLPEHDS